MGEKRFWSLVRTPYLWAKKTNCKPRQFIVSNCAGKCPKINTDEILLCSHLNYPDPILRWWHLIAILERSLNFGSSKKLSNHLFSKWFDFFPHSYLPQNQLLLSRWFDSFFEEPKFKLSTSMAITCHYRRVGARIIRFL